MALHPYAVGLVHLPVSATERERTEARIALALRAAEEGYALIETYESGGNGLREDAALQALEELAVRLDAAALFYVGPVNLVRVRDIAKRVRMVIVAANGK